MEKNDNYIIRPGTNYSPNSEIFLQMSTTRLSDFYRWFMEIKPYCLEELMQLVTTTCGFDNWVADDTPESLYVLGLWFFSKVQKRDFTEEEMSWLTKNQDKSTDFLTWDLTEQTKSYALFIGMYYGEVAIKNGKNIRWEHLVSDKRRADYGQPILVGQKNVPINPVRVAHSLAYRYLSGNANADALRKAYDFWANLSDQSHH